MPKAKSDKDVRRLWMTLARGRSLVEAARWAGMSLPTARKYWECGQMPSEIRPQRDWRTRSNPFEEVWPEIEALIQDEPQLKAKTIFEELQTKYPGRPPSCEPVILKVRRSSMCGSRLRNKFSTIGNRRLANTRSSIWRFNLVGRPIASKSSTKTKRRADQRPKVVTGFNACWPRSVWITWGLFWGWN